MDAVFHALAHPARRILIDELAGRNDRTLYDLTVCLISDHGLAMTRQAVTKHLAVLRAAGLVCADPVGRTTVHHLDTRPLVPARQWLDAVPATAPAPPPGRARTPTRGMGPGTAAHVRTDPPAGTPTHPLEGPR